MVPLCDEQCLFKAQLLDFLFGQQFGFYFALQKIWKVSKIQMKQASQLVEKVLHAIYAHELEQKVSETFHVNRKGL